MNLYIKYSTSKYEWLCFKHATMEAMRGEKVETDLVDSGYFNFATDSCNLCVADEEKAEEKLKIWYDKYRENK